jgi:hypothetical protein
LTFSATVFKEFILSKNRCSRKSEIHPAKGLVRSQVKVMSTVLIREWWGETGN